MTRGPGTQREIQVSEDLEFQRRSWQVERAGWVVMALLILAAVLGMFGSGLFSKTTIQTTSGHMQPTYERALHRGTSSSQLQVTIQPEQADASRATLWLEQSLAKGMLIEHITPEPESVATTVNDYIYTFSSTQPLQPVQVVFHYKPQERGIITSQVGTSPHDSVIITQFVIP